MTNIRGGSGLFAGNTPQPLALIVLLFWAALIVPAGSFSIPPLDRDESRFMQATVQMLETGDFIAIRFQEDERNKKPAGIYWLQAASVSAFSDAEARQPWAFRIPSMLAGVLSILLLCALFSRLTGPAPAFWGAVLLAAAPTFAGEATIAKTDAALTTCVIAAQGCLALIFRRYVEQEEVGWRVPVFFWVAIGVGILIKGPIAPMISFLTIAALGLWLLATGRNPFRFGLAHRPFTGLGILALIVGPWAIAIGLATEGRFFTEALGDDAFGKLNEVQENHDGSFLYYLKAVWIFFWPAALFIPLAVWHAIQRWRDPAVAFCLAWLVPSWILFEIASTKLTHYTLPLYPALAVLIALSVLSLREVIPGPGERIMRGIGILTCAGASLVVGAALVWLVISFDDHGLTAFHVALLGVLGIIAITAGALMSLRRPAAAMAAASLAGAVLAWGLFEGILPRLEALHLTPRVSRLLDDLDLHPRLDGAPPVALYGYNEPSLVFLLGTDTIHAEAEGMAAWIAAAPGHVAIVDEENQAAFLAATQQTRLSVLATLDGFNYSNNKASTLTVYISE
ncbi:ArnT family glycosyltransferase [Aquisalinus luteolus]|nr:glycosyltransferase family 39 protein [Aquisalinus luteolus]